MTHLPFQALVGLELAQQALLLLAVEPRLKGVVLSAAAGTGKSSLARGLRAVLGNDETPFVELPPSIDSENLLGGLDLEATLRSGKLVLQPGVLARAHGGIAYVDGINLLGDASANVLLAVLDEGTLRVEREGISRHVPAHFGLIGSYDPAEGLPRRHLLDRVALLAPLPAASDAGQRVDVIRRNLIEPAERWLDDRDFLRGLLATARDHLPNVTISEAQIRRLSALALQYGVEGHRADVFAVWAACAAAALELRDAVEDDDLLLAARLVILPRATRMPAAEDPPPPPPPPEPPPPDPDDTDDEDDGDALPESLLPPPEQILQALATELPAALEDLPFMTLRRGRSGSRGSTSGKRGRHIRSVPGDPRRQRIDIIATLRAAAPWQPLRRVGAPSLNGTHDQALLNGHAPSLNGHAPALNGDAPAINGHAPSPARQRIALRIEDVRVKQYRSKAGALFCFAVDASGSMALHRMRQAKGAVNALLQQAYVNRDRVALLAFRGRQAELLLPPSQSVELARRALDLLPTGGGTPLASALLLALDVAQQARQRGILQTVLVLLTDGRANVGLRDGGDVPAELQAIGRHIAASGLHVIVVDTQRSYLSRGEARRLAEWLGGDYAYLPNASGEQIAALATNASS